MFRSRSWCTCQSRGRKYLNVIQSRFYHYTSDKRSFGQRILPKDRNNPVTAQEEANRVLHSNILRAVNNFRTHGHRASRVNPLTVSQQSECVPELNLGRYKLESNDSFNPNGIIHGPDFQNQNETNVASAFDFLKTAYAGFTGYEFMYIEDEAEREWLTREIESRSATEIPGTEKVQVALEMVKSQNFDHFLASKFPTVKRYGGEGCESVMAFYNEFFRSCGRLGIDNVVIAQAHRGRLNFLTGPLKVPPVRVFHKIKGFPEFPSDAQASGDVLSHLYTTIDLEMEDGKTVHVSTLPNPSHLEAINPVAVGKARAKQLALKNYDYAENETNEDSRVVCLQIHGDAALAGQGINQETLGFANVPNFRIGGSVHLVINNQVGFTTPQEIGRSSRYTTDVAKCVGAPVIHVNADFPEEIIKGTKLALDYRQQFGKDIFIDLVCFRRWGHNEMDDPTFTNPELYKLIHSRKSIPDEYCNKLISEGLLSPETLTETLREHNAYLNDNLKQIESYQPSDFYLKKQWAGIVQPGKETTTWETGIRTDLLQYIGVKSVDFPQDFKVHPHLLKMHVKNRLSKVTAGTSIDWATAEAMAFGSLLYQDLNVRLSGEDVGRGTFSHRHAMLVDQNDGGIFVPLNSLVENQTKFLEISNSTLSEEAVLAFEYGFSIENPHNLVVWEAQFGDFFNGAQIIIDTFVASGEAKWMLQSGLVILLPHGMDGAGPEHSSCRIERFLQLTDSSEHFNVDGDFNNFQVVNPTTPAQYFHLLRRQVLRNFRKPLVMVAPKTLLRLSAATSSLADMGPGTHFLPVLGDASTANSSKQVTKLIFVSGKHYYALEEKRREMKDLNTAIIRIESLCPFPITEIEREIARYPNANKIIWSQEEHRNQGAWTFVKARFENLLGKEIEYVGRETLGAPAVGVSQVHQREAAKIIQDTFL